MNEKLVDKLQNIHEFIKEKIVIKIHDCEYSIKDRELMFLSLLLEKPNKWSNNEYNKVKNLLYVLNPFIQIEQKKVIFTLMLKAQLNINTPSEILKSYITELDNLFMTDDEFNNEYYNMWNDLSDLADEKQYNIESLSDLIEHIESEFDEDGDLSINALLFKNLSLDEQYSHLKCIEHKIINNIITNTNIKEAYEVLSSIEDDEYNEYITILDYREENDDEIISSTTQNEINELKKSIILLIENKLPKEYLEINN